MTIEDAKKINAPTKRKKGMVYGVNKEEVVEFHKIETLPMECFDNKSLEVCLKGFFERFEQQSKVNKALKEVIKNQAKRLDYLEKVVEKYGMVD